MSERWQQFNESVGALTWRGKPASEHPDRCVCQGDDSTPHKHYADVPSHSCARCTECQGYQPAIPSPPAPGDAETLHICQFWGQLWVAHDQVQKLLAESRRLAGEVADQRKQADYWHRSFDAMADDNQAWSIRCVEAEKRAEQLAGEVAQLKVDVASLRLERDAQECQRLRDNSHLLARAEAAEGEVARLRDQCDAVDWDAVQEAILWWGTELRVAKNRHSDNEQSVIDTSLAALQVLTRLRPQDQP